MVGISLLKDKKLLDPRKELVELRVFKWVLFVGLMLTAVSFILIAYNSNLDWDFSYLGFNFFIVAFKVPLGLFTATISIIGLIALAHRSSQTKVQIDLSTNQFEASQQQNVFANYYKHIEEFEKHVKNYEIKEKAEGLNVRLAHHKLFPSARSGNFTPITLEPIGFSHKLVSILEKSIRLLDDEQIEHANIYFNESIYKNELLSEFCSSVRSLETDIFKLHGSGKDSPYRKWDNGKTLVQVVDMYLYPINLKLQVSILESYH